MRVIGRIKEVFPEKRMISVYNKNKVSFYYFERAEFNRFEKYLEIERFVDIRVLDMFQIINKRKAYKISKVERIMQHRNRRAQVYFSLEDVRQGIKKVLKHHKVRMFLDLEMSMHPFYRTDNFTQEVIQVGYVLEDDNGVIESFETYIKPIKHPVVTSRTIKFLKITQEEIDQGMEATEFYNLFSKVIRKYRPKIYTWGKNDLLALQSFSKLQKKKMIVSKRNVIDLLAIYKTYHGVKNDVGLFKCYESYGNEITKQSHNALEDAEITRLIYHEFLNDVRKHI